MRERLWTDDGLDYDQIITWIIRAAARPATYRTNLNLIERHIATAPIASIPLQRLRGSDIERYYADGKAASASLEVHHAILHKALKRAVKDCLLMANPAVDLERLTRDPSSPAAANCAGALVAASITRRTSTADQQCSRAAAARLGALLHG